MNTDNQRNEKGRFVAGNKGGGRRKVPDEVKKMFLAATPDATRLLIETMNNEDAPLKIRIDCANTVIERVYGKAAQPLTTADEAESLKVLIEIEGAKSGAKS